MKSKSFFEVLEEQLRIDLRREIEAEVRAELGRKTSQIPRAKGSEGRLETWLTANIDKVFIPRDTQARKAYGAPRKTAAPPSHRRSASGIEELCALEILNRHSGQRLGDFFSEDELKSAWRKAALRTHPDRFAQTDVITQTRMAIVFRETCDAFERLQGLFEAA